MARRVTVERQLKNLDSFIQQRKRQVTRKPVYTEVSHSRFGKNEMAHLISHPTVARPREYSVVFKDTFYNRNKNQNPQKLRQIAAHELAHIVVPHQHTKEFVHTARKLGAGKYANTKQG
jgi:hypothetical protein